MKSILPILILALLQSLSPAADPRAEISLNGGWGYQKVEQLETLPGADGWKPTQVPGTMRGFDYERAWFRRTFTLPAAQPGRRVKIEFDGVKYDSRVYVNGKHVGGCFNGYDAFEVDVTDALLPEGCNELLVGCHDWTGVFSPGKVDFSQKPAWQRPRRFVRDKVIAPIGGHCDYYGIWGDVRLKIVPPVYVKDFFIKPSVRNGELVVDYQIANESAGDVEVELSAMAEDQGQVVLSLPSVRLKVASGAVVSATLRQAWPGARRWSHEDPYLHQLITRLSSGDVVKTRFGFREFWIEGHKYFLNGSRINLLASSWWPPTAPVERDEVEALWRKLKACGCNCFRTHTQPWRRVHYDVADEVGLLMIPEAAVWHDPYCTAYDNPTFWDNYAETIRAMIARQKNRASVIMWSLGNEVYGGGDEKTGLAVKNLARLGAMAKKWDPTRPIYFESDGDPGGVADAVGLHYVHEYPKYTCWPNEAYWLEKPFSPQSWFGDQKEFVWNHEKPLYIGEFLWVPSGTPAAHTVFFGDDAYRDWHLYTRKAKAEAWKMQILAFRHDEAGGFCPWTVGTDLDDDNPLYQAHKYAYQPIAAYCHDYDRRFFSGRPIARRVEVFNDILAPSKLELLWTLSSAGKILQKNRQVFSLPPGEKRMLDIELQMPPAERRTPVEWELTLRREGKQVFNDLHRYSVFPQPAPPKLSVPIGLYDPAGSTHDLLVSLGIRHSAVKSLDQIDGRLSVVAIGDRTLKQARRQPLVVGRTDPRRDALRRFLARGGRLLVLRQQDYPEGLFDVGLTSQQSTMTFPLRHDHPALAGLQAEDLKFWRNDHLVSDRELARPVSGAAVTIVASGSAAGLANTPLLERPLGKGCIVHSQFRLVEKAAAEPVAGLILANLLTYLSDYRPASRRTAVLGGSTEYTELLRNLGLRFEHFANAGDDFDPQDYSLVVHRGGSAVSDEAISRLRTYVQRGGNLLLHRTGSEALETFAKTLGLDLTLAPYAGSVRRAEGNSTILGAITREDLYWTARRPGLSWSYQPPATEAADGVLARLIDISQAAETSIDGWEIEGSYVRRQSPGVLFASAGTATGQIEFPVSGRYAIGITARGSVCEGVYPVAQISVDGRPFGTIQLDGPDWKAYGAFGDVEKGPREVSLAFINDASRPPEEDRNLEVRNILTAPDANPDQIEFLTRPPVVVAARSGQGRVVLDQLRWDTEEANSRPAARYAVALLTELGGNFTPKPSTTIQCEQMTPQPEMKHFSNQGGIATMACNGWIKTDLQVALAGRYTMELVASGTISDGVYPLLSVKIDDRAVGQIQLNTDGWRTYPLEVELAPGSHELSLEFVNDFNSAAGEDRNLRVDKVVFSAAP